MQGCFRNLLASVGCLTVLAVGGVVAWVYRAQVAGLYRSVFRAEAPVTPPSAESVPPPPQPVVPTAPARVPDAARPAPSTERGAAPRPADVAEQAPRPGRPSAAALRSARAKEASMARRDGPSYVVLTADEMASLIADGLDPAARAALDSLETTLMVDRFELRGQIKTAVLEGMLGPLGAMLNEREPLVIAGAARVAGVGVVAWEPDSLMLRAFPFPRAAIPLLVNRLTGGNDGTLLIAVPPTVGDLRIRPSGATFYRRVNR